MGIYSGVPIRVGPHTTAGRADYFGTLVCAHCQLVCLAAASLSWQLSNDPAFPMLQVNRCARYANGASHGGQITCPCDVMEEIVSKLTGAECPPMQEQGKPYLLQVAGVCVVI